MTRENSYSHALSIVGLAPQQTLVYETLLKRGSMQAGKVSTAVNLSRPNVYKILEELIEFGLIVKEQPIGKATQFTPLHPFALRDFLRKKDAEIQLAKQSIDGIMGSLVSDYTTASQVPGIRILPGIDGLEEMYDDLLNEGKDMFLIRSTLDDDKPELQQLVTDQIEKQIKAGMHLRVVAPEPRQNALTPTELLKRDAVRLTTRRVLPREQFTLPAQFFIYGSKVAITAYEGPIMTTIIDNSAIQKTLSIIFEFMWSIGKKIEVNIE